MGDKQKNSKFHIEFKGGLKVLGTKKRVLASTRINSGVRNRESVPYGLVKRLSMRRLMESPHALEGEILDAFEERSSAVRKIEQLSGKLVSGEFLHILD